MKNSVLPGLTSSLFASAQLGACGTETHTHATSDTGLDAVVVIDATALDGAVEDQRSVEDSPTLDISVGQDASADLASPPDTSVEPGPWTVGVSYRVEGPAGVWTAGELIALYDHRLWWGAAEADQTLALFDADRFADWPDDDSVQFVAEHDIISSETILGAAPTMRDWLTEKGMGWQRVPLDGVAYVMAASERHHLAERGYGDYATDLGRTDLAGQRWTGDGLDLRDYTSWDVPVFAPVDGVIVEVTREEPDSPIGGDPAVNLDAPENLVGLWLGGSWHAYLLHFQKDSVPTELTVGGTVKQGDLLGRIGNSGTSTEPHLHLVLHYWDAARGRYWSVPVDYLDVHTSTAPDGSRPAPRVRPTGGTWIADEPF